MVNFRDSMADLTEYFSANHQIAIRRIFTRAIPLTKIATQLDIISDESIALRA
jgi:hypothetical protein